MQEPELALFTTQELIDEIMRRSTFLGVIVHSEKENKSKHWEEERIFKVRFNSNLNAAQTGRLLGTVAARLDYEEK